MSEALYMCIILHGRNTRSRFSSIVVLKNYFMLRFSAVLVALVQEDPAS